MPAQSRAQARQFAELLSKLSPEVRRAFMAAVADLHAHVDWPALLSALEAGNTGSAIAAINISEAAFSDYAQVMTAAFIEAGSATSAIIISSGAGRVGLRFRYHDPRAASWIEQNVANRVVGFAQEQITAARSLIDAGFGRGEHPHNIARDLAGMVNPLSRVREGGILGLDGPRAYRFSQVSVGMRSAEGVQSLVVRHADGSLSMRYKVNPATEKRIMRAYLAGTEVPQQDRILSEAQYHNALLKARADTIAETETGNAVIAARQESWAQAAEDMELDASAIIKTWQHRRGPSKYHRPDHYGMSGVEVRGLDTPFVFPDGVALKHAHDPDGPAEHLIRCGCDTEYRIDRRRAQ